MSRFMPTHKGLQGSTQERCDKVELVQHTPDEENRFVSWYYGSRDGSRMSARTMWLQIATRALPFVTSTGSFRTG